MADTWSIKPAVMAFDGGEDVRFPNNVHKRSNVPAYRLNEGIDHEAQRELALHYTPDNPDKAMEYAKNTRHVFGGYRNYGILPPAFDVNGQPGVTSKVMPGDGAARRRALVTHWVYGDDDVNRGRESTLDDILAGKYDGNMKTYVKTLPIGKNRPDDTPPWSFRMPVMGEIDVIVQKGWLRLGGIGKEPLALRDKARAAVLHQVDVLTTAALDMGATPEEFGAGGLVTRWTMDRVGNPTHSGYDWWRDFSTTITDPEQRRLVVGFVNPYYYHLTPDSIEDARTDLRMHKSVFANAGINRYIVSETTCGLGTRQARQTSIGSAAGQVEFVRHLGELLDEGTVEWVGYFHAPGGYASDQGALRGAPLRELALLAERINL